MHTKDKSRFARPSDELHDSHNVRAAVRQRKRVGAGISEAWEIPSDGNLDGHCALFDLRSWAVWVLSEVDKDSGGFWVCRRARWVCSGCGGNDGLFRVWCHRLKVPDGTGTKSDPRQRLFHLKIVLGCDFSEVLVLMELMSFEKLHLGWELDE